MTSDFVSFAATTQRDYSLSLNAVTQPIATSSGYLRSFTADGTGTFASDPAPFANVPEPASVALLLLGCVALRRRRHH